MRQLGRGHTVSFIASFEADLQIGTWRAESKKNLAATNLEHLPSILSWCLSNTVWWTCDKLVYLAAQGVSQLRKRYAALCHASDPTLMATSCAEVEALALEE